MENHFSKWFGFYRYCTHAHKECTARPILSDIHDQILLWEVLRDRAGTLDWVIPTFQVTAVVWARNGYPTPGGGIVGPRNLSDYCGQGRQRMKLLNIAVEAGTT